MLRSFSDSLHLRVDVLRPAVVPMVSAMTRTVPATIRTTERAGEDATITATTAARLITTAVRGVIEAAGRQPGVNPLSLQGYRTLNTPEPNHERRALHYSAAGSLLVGCVALVFAYLSGSSAILLDGLFNLSYFTTGLFTLKVTQLLARGDTREFPLGYGHFEPLTNGLKGILVLGVSCMAGVDAFIALLSGGRAISAGMAIAYGAFATATCWTVALLMRAASRKTSSPLVHADAANWLVNAAISTGVLLTFLSILLLRELGLDTLVPYVDPVLVLAVTALCIMIPIRMAWAALMALLNRAPANVTDEVRETVEGAIAELPVRELFVRVIQPGRMRHVMAHVVLPEDFGVESLSVLDEVRASTLRRLAEQYPEVVLDMLFMVDRAWGAPLVETE